MKEAVLALLWPATILLALAGWGATGLKLFARDLAPSFDGPLAAAFFGLFFVTLIVLLINFWWGLGVNPGAWFVAGGLSLFTIQGYRKPSWRSEGLFLVLVASAFSLFFRDLRFGYDAGLYHLSYMHWVADGPVPLGLANVEGRLGFNSAWLLFVSATRTESLSGWSNVIHAEIAIHALAVAWLFWQFLKEVQRGWTRGAVLFAASTVLVSLYLVLLGWRTSTDHTANLCAFLAWTCLSKYMLAGDNAGKQEVQGALITTLLFSVLAVSSKLSMLPILILPGILLTEARRSGNRLGPDARRWFSILGIFCVAWLARSVMLSGCAIFPVQSTCFPVKWAVPGAVVGDISTIIMAVARIPGPGYQEAMALLSTNWIPAWVNSTAKSIPMLLTFLVLLLSSLLWITSSARVHQEGELSRRCGCWIAHSMVVVGAGILLWFVKAPDPRFSWAFFAILGTTLLCSVVFLREIELPEFRSLPVGAAGRALVWAIPLYLALIAFGMDGWKAPTPPEVSTEQVVSLTGWQAMRPTHGDQCWKNFPCTSQSVKPIDARLVAGRWHFSVVGPAAR